jgi:Leucine-rich repeat (LRR) protein
MLLQLLQNKTEISNSEATKIIKKFGLINFLEAVNNSTLTTLYLFYNNEISDEGCNYLSKNTTLTTLDLSDNNIGDEGCNYLSKNTTLTTLDLSDNNIGDEGCKHLSKNTTLTTLNLSNNNIGDDGCDYLSENTTLTTLKLCSNNIEDEGCKYLSKNTTLTTLYFYNNKIGDEGCKHLSKNTTLLKITGNKKIKEIGDRNLELLNEKIEVEEKLFDSLKEEQAQILISLKKTMSNNIIMEYEKFMIKTLNIHRQNLDKFIERKSVIE